MEPTHSKSWLLQIVKALEISREINIQGLPILVEGKRDKDILLKLGFSGPIEILNRGWDLDKLVVYLLEKYDNSNTLKNLTSNKAGNISTTISSKSGLVEEKKMVLFILMIGRNMLCLVKLQDGERHTLHQKNC